MDPISRLNYEYALFNNTYNRLPFTVPQPPPQTPHTLTPAGILVPAPEEPPLRPAFMLFKDHVIKFIEGAASATLIMAAIMVKGVLLKFVLLLGGLAAGYFYVNSHGDMARFRVEERLWMDRRVLPPRPPPQHFVFQ
jgi:hypothetical protein